MRRLSILFAMGLFMALLAVLPSCGNNRGTISEDEMLRMRIACNNDMSAVQSGIWAFHSVAGYFPTLMAVVWPDYGQADAVDWYAPDGYGNTFVPDYITAKPSTDVLCNWWINSDGMLRPGPYNLLCPCGP